MNVPNKITMCRIILSIILLIVLIFPLEGLGIDFPEIRINSKIENIASEILLKLYETICQKVNYKEATWESFGIQDSDVFKNEIEHLRANN